MGICSTAQRVSFMEELGTSLHLKFENTDSFSAHYVTHDLRLEQMIIIEKEAIWERVNKRLSSGILISVSLVFNRAFVVNLGDMLERWSNCVFRWDIFLLRPRDMVNWDFILTRAVFNLLLVYLFMQKPSPTFLMDSEGTIHV